jgi:hypothetical protein
MKTQGTGHLRLLMRAIDQGFDRVAWHGPTLWGAIRGVTAKQAAWRPGRGRHNIWELVLHTAYWKYAVRQRLAGGRQGSFPRPGSNFPRLPKVLDEGHWREDVRLLKEEHRKLRQAIAAVPAGALGRRLGRKRWTTSETIHGVAMHDLYHAGQIQLLKRLAARR